MIARLDELLDELLDVARAARALPHVIEHSRALELRVIALEGQVCKLEERVSANDAIVSELYLSPPSDAEVPDA